MSSRNRDAFDNPRERESRRIDGVSESDDAADVFVLEHTLLLGVWTNGTKVRLGRDEITIDFVRDVPELPRRVLVARILAPPRAAFDLRDDLGEVLRSYTDRSMPEDVT